MSRFGNLEFEGGREEESQARSSVRDEHYYLSEAQQAYENGEFEKGLLSYSRVLEYNPSNVAAWIGQARMFIELERFEEANNWADQALERFPNEPEVFAVKAVALGRLGQVQEAMAFSDASIEGHGSTPYVWLARGDVLLAGGEDRAEGCFAKALALAVQDWFARWLAARIYHFYKKLTQALKYAQQALALASDRSVVWLQLGLCQQGLGLIGPAQHSFTQARDLNPQSREARRALATVSAAGPLAYLKGLWRQLFYR
jgi:tetratricopeptide (TPR) repeat protein